MRTRLSTEQRREQLLSIGAELFAGRPYDDVWIEEVAERAGVSRGLLYHYFTTKREFFADVVRAEADRLLRLTEPDPELPLAERLTACLDAYLDYAAGHRAGYRVVHRAAVAADEEIRRICERGLAVQRRRVLDALGADPEEDAALDVAVHAWLMFVITACLDWLDRPSVDRWGLREMCARTLFAAVGVPVAPGLPGGAGEAADAAGGAGAPKTPAG